MLKRFFLVVAVASISAVIITATVTLNIAVLSIISILISLPLIYCYIKFSFKFLDIFIVFLLSFSIILFYNSFYMSSNLNYNKNLFGKTYYINAKVCDETKNYDSSSMHFLKITKIDNKTVRPFKAIVSSEGVINTEIGDEFCGVVKFDSTATRKSYFSENIYCGGDFENFSFRKSQRFNLFKASVKCRKFIENRFNSNLNSDVSGIPIALLTGNKEFISDKFYADIKETGMAHVMAVSGLHISIICGSVVLLLRKLKFGRKISAVVGIIILLLMGFISGFGGSIIRATIMHLVIFLGDLFSRRADALNSLGLAVTIMFLINPFSIYNIGFLMSALATLGILTLSPVIYNKFSIKTDETGKLIKLYNNTLQILSLSVSASVFVAPISLYYFNYLSVIAPLVNLAISFLVTVILTLTAILALIPLGLGYNVLGFLCTAFKAIITFFANFEFCGFSSDDLLLYITILIIFIVILLAKYNKHKSLQIIFSLLVVVLVVSTSIFQLNINKNTYKIYIPHSYSGMALVIHNNDTCVIISNTNDYGAVNDINYYLSNKFIDDVDLLIIPTDKEKHYQKLSRIITSRNVKSIYSNGLKNTKDVSDIKGIDGLNITSYLSNNEYILSFELGSETFVFNTNGLYFGECDYVLTDKPLVSHSLIGENTHYFIPKYSDETIYAYKYLLNNKCSANLILDNESLTCEKYCNKTLKFRD